MIRLYEFLFGCWHDWGKWSEPKVFDATREPSLLNASDFSAYFEQRKINFTITEQYRACKKCGLQQIRVISP